MVGIHRWILLTGIGPYDNPSVDITIHHQYDNPSVFAKIFQELFNRKIFLENLFKNNTRNFLWEKACPVLIRWFAPAGVFSLLFISFILFIFDTHCTYFPENNFFVVKVSEIFYIVKVKFQSFLLFIEKSFSRKILSLNTSLSRFKQYRK